MGALTIRAPLVNHSHGGLVMHVVPCIDESDALVRLAAGLTACDF